MGCMLQSEVGRDDGADRLGPTAATETVLVGGDIVDVILLSHFAGKKCR